MNNEKIELPFGASDSELCGWEYTIPDGMEAEIKDGKVIVRKKESEDERIRKLLLDRFKLISEMWFENTFNGYLSKEQFLSWLEKHKEGNLVEKSYVQECYNKGYEAGRMQKSAEWSEEDTAMVDYVHGLCYKEHEEADTAQDANKATKCISWLKSLRPNHWKPSEEQMDALKLFVYNRPTGSVELSILGTLYSDLKKLI